MKRKQKQHEVLGKFGYSLLTKLPSHWKKPKEIIAEKEKESYEGYLHKDEIFVTWETRGDYDNLILVNNQKKWITDKPFYLFIRLLVELKKKHPRPVSQNELVKLGLLSKVKGIQPIHRLKKIITPWFTKASEKRPVICCDHSAYKLLVSPAGVNLNKINSRNSGTIIKQIFSS